jgi:hypothetical protein
MLSQPLKTVVWAVALSALPGLTQGGPPTAGECALLGWRSLPQPGSNNLRLADIHAPVIAGQALLGKLSSTEAPDVAGEAIRIQVHPIDGASALVGR